MGSSLGWITYGFLCGVGVAFILRPYICKRLMGRLARISRTIEEKAIDKGMPIDGQLLQVLLAIDGLISVAPLLASGTGQILVTRDRAAHEDVTGLEEFISANGWLTGYLAAMILSLCVLLWLARPYDPRLWRPALGSAALFSLCSERDGGMRMTYTPPVAARKVRKLLGLSRSRTLTTAA